MNMNKLMELLQTVCVSPPVDKKDPEKNESISKDDKHYFPLSAKDLVDIEKVSPGTGERLLKIDENNAEHRRKMEKAELMNRRMKMILFFLAHVLAIMAWAFSQQPLTTKSEPAKTAVIHQQPVEPSHDAPVIREWKKTGELSGQLQRFVVTIEAWVPFPELVPKLPRFFPLSIERCDQRTAGHPEALAVRGGHFPATPD